MINEHYEMKQKQVFQYFHQYEELFMAFEMNVITLSQWKISDKSNLYFILIIVIKFFFT